VNSVLKQRLVGALILIALGAIFWPMIFVNTGLAPIDQRSQIPPTISTRQVEIPIPQPSARVTTAQSPSEAAEINPYLAVVTDTSTSSDTPPVKRELQPAETAPKVAIADKPALDKNGIPIAWVLQVASFEKAETATKVRQELIAMGYKADSRTVSSAGKKLVRVTVGPKFDRQTLVKTKLILDKHYKVNSIIARYTP
jgi:DedD protein